MAVDPKLAKEAKAIVLLALRNGLLGDLHAGAPCPTCCGDTKYSHITQVELGQLMKQAVDRIYTLLWCKGRNPMKYDALVEGASVLTATWDEPKDTTKF